jgi:hypothetical protein
VSSRELWRKISEQYRQHADFYTDLYESYVDVIANDWYHTVTNQNGLTNNIERFNSDAGTNLFILRLREYHLRVL